MPHIYIHIYFFLIRLFGTASLYMANAVIEL